VKNRSSITARTFFCIKFNPILAWYVEASGLQ